MKLHSTVDIHCMMLPAAVCLALKQNPKIMKNLDNNKIIVNLRVVHFQTMRNSGSANRGNENLRHLVKKVIRA